MARLSTNSLTGSGFVERLSFNPFFNLTSKISIF